MPVLIVLYLLFIGFAALLAQMVLPVIFPILSVIGFNSALIPLVVIYASLELGDERAPILAGILGLFLDLSLDLPHRVGTSVLILTSLSTLIVTQAHKPESHSWIFRLVYVLVGTFIYLTLDYIFNLVETARWYWPLSAWSKITFGALLNLVLTPFFFYLIGIPPRWCGWKPAYDSQERYYAR